MYYEAELFMIKLREPPSSLLQAQIKTYYDLKYLRSQTPPTSFESLMWFRCMLNAIHWLCQRIQLLWTPLVCSCHCFCCSYCTCTHSYHDNSDDDDDDGDGDKRLRVSILHTSPTQTTQNCTWGNKLCLHIRSMHCPVYGIAICLVASC